MHRAQHIMHSPKPPEQHHVAKWTSRADNIIHADPTLVASRMSADSMVWASNGCATSTRFPVSARAGIACVKYLFREAVKVTAKRSRIRVCAQLCRTQCGNKAECQQRPSTFKAFPAGFRFRLSFPLHILLFCLLLLGCLAADAPLHINSVRFMKPSLVKTATHPW